MIFKFGLVSEFQEISRYRDKLYDGIHWEIKYGNWKLQYQNLVFRKNKFVETIR